ncbi:pyruvate/2-oxoglutarate dehydrogenase complex, dihydrolipoamide dehydrogenase component [Burkholderiales bacterium JOSHI_001]|nr:pyruvate/2-oxoglutarate dehydrogenase complex, dihydrolipoamide dehydrogenase component [Burkholderiales bacterium JOSHI_001]
MSDTYDLITLGAGSGGVAASRRAALHGAKVAIVEGRRVGGTCVLRGCVPKKLLMYAAQMGDTFTEARGYGWTLDAPRFSMAHWAAAKAAETARLEGVYRRLLEGSGVTLIEGWARLDGPQTVVVGERRLTAPHVLIATGSSPVTDSIPGIEHCATSDDLLDLQALPERAAVIGGGFIAVEFASMLARLGVTVTLFFRDRAPLRGFDETLRSAAAAALQAAGVSLRAGMVPTQVQRSAAGLLLAFGEERVLDFPWVLNATGRRPNTQGLGLALDAHGAVPVDADLQTALPGVYAIGDVTNRKNLTPVAIAEGRALADSLFGGTPRRVDLGRVPSAVFMLPPIATVGPTEAEALAAGHTLKVYETDFRPMKQAFVGGGERTHMKLLVDAATDRVLAVHMIGADAPEIIQALAVALSAGATKAHFDHTLALHPSAAEEFVLMREPTRTVAPGA